jgi:hypothetical protein
MDQDEARRQLALIHDVVDRSRRERAASGDIYVVWGAVVCFCLAATVLGDWLGWSAGWIAWPLLMPFASGYSVWSGRRNAMQVGTFVGRVEGHLWGAITVALVIVVFGGLSTGALALTAAIPVVSAIAGVGMVASGALYRSPLMTWPGWMFIGVSAVCLPLPWQVQYGVFGVAIAVGYIVPGVLMMRASR